MSTKHRLGGDFLWQSITTFVQYVGKSQRKEQAGQGKHSMTISNRL